MTQLLDIEKLMKGRPLDNLRFLQWLKGFYDEQTASLQNDTEEQRLGLRRLPAASSNITPPAFRSASPSNCIAASPLQPKNQCNHSITRPQSASRLGCQLNSASPALCQPEHPHIL